MRKILSAKQMQRADEYTTEVLKVPSVVLMERAALSVCEFIYDRFEKDIRISVCCGVGNNGGDGMAIVRLLRQKGYCVKWNLVGKHSRFSESAKLQYDILCAYGYEESGSLTELLDCDLFIDAIFGVGLNRDVSAEMQKVFQRINSINCEKLAVDIPSGINATTGSIMGEAIRCDYTVTFAYEKLGHLLYRGRDYCGEVVCSDIGINVDFSEGSDRGICAYEIDDLKNMLPKRVSDSHKGTYGRVLVIAGKKDMAGAAYLAAKASYLTGCGLVKIYTEEDNRVILQSLLPEAMLTTYRSKFSKTSLKKDLGWATTVLIGPALGTGEDKSDLLKFVLENCSVPLLLDADALNIISRDMSLFKTINAPCVITPHIGEMGQLLATQVFEVLSNMLQTTVNFSVEHNVITVLKSASTVVAAPDGSASINMFGNNGMATGGSGDVLAGIIAGFLAQKCDIKTASILGVNVHALSGDAARDMVGAYSMKAEDILDGLKVVLKYLEKLS